MTKQKRLSFLQTSLLIALSVPRTSIRLHFVNAVHADRISDVLGFEFSQEVYSDGTKVGLFWILPDADGGVEVQMKSWISLLKKVQRPLKELCSADLGAYLDIRVYENDFYLYDEWLLQLGKMGIEISVWFMPPNSVVWQEPDHESTIVLQGPVFHSKFDESEFFSWLQRIDGVKGVRGSGLELIVFLSVSKLSKDSLREFIALLHRYGVPMSVLRSQVTPENERWFKDHKAYWYNEVFCDS